MDWQKKSQEILDKIHSYGKEQNGWKEMKKEVILIHINAK